MRSISLFILMLSGMVLFAQNKENSNAEAEQFPYLYFTGSYNFPGGDLSVRYGNNTSVGAGFGYKFLNDFQVNLEGLYLFGNNVNEHPISPLYASTGSLITSQGGIALVTEELSGMHFKLEVGKVIQVFNSKPGNGLLVKASAGFLSHKIWLQNTDKNAFQIEGEYEKGYDRLCNGSAFTQFIGWNHFSQKRGLHFFGGFEITEAFTENRRSWDFALKKKLTGVRNDFLYSIKLGWYIPLKSRKASGYYYY